VNPWDVAVVVDPVTDRTEVVDVPDSVVAEPGDVDLG
jgi:hypothetical protein